MIDTFLLICTVLFVLAELFTIYNATINKKYDLIIQNVLLIGLVVLLVVFNDRFQYPIYSFILMFFMITLIGHTLLGQSLDYYHKSKIFDRYLHCFGAFSISLLFYSILLNIWGPIQGGKGYIALLIATSGIALGTLFEILEFIIDTVSKNAKMLKHQHGLADTDIDLISNTAGALLAGILSVYIFGS